MNHLSGDTVTLSELVRTEEHGLNVNRLLFAKFLVMTGRISEGAGNTGQSPLSVLSSNAKTVSGDVAAMAAVKK